MSTQTPQGRGRKSRIVIDVARMQAEARGRRGGPGSRRRRILSIAALAVVGLVLVVLVGSYAWWQSYKKSPAYSLALHVDAAQREDMQGVESLIDSDRVAQGFIPQVIENLAGAGSPLRARTDHRVTPNTVSPIAPSISTEIRPRVVSSSGDAVVKWSRLMSPR